MLPFNTWYLIFAEKALLIVFPACNAVFICCSPPQTHLRARTCTYENTHTQYGYTKTRTTSKPSACNYLARTVLQNARQCLHQRVCV